MHSFFSLFKNYLFIFSGTGAGTQDLAVGRQAFYHSGYAPNQRMFSSWHLLPPPA
jgi:hypothetical protein